MFATIEHKYSAVVTNLSNLSYIFILTSRLFQILPINVVIFTADKAFMVRLNLNPVTEIQIFF